MLDPGELNNYEDEETIVHQISKLKVLTLPFHAQKPQFIEVDQNIELNGLHCLNAQSVSSLYSTL